ncbi:MAG: hypothetical protein ACTHM2_05085 [Afipia sp.]
MRRSKIKGPRLVSQAWLAKHLDVTPARISQLVKDGEFVPGVDGKLDPDACRVRYIRWLRDETRRSSQSEQRKRLEAAKARGEELRVAREENRLVEMDEVEAVFADILGTFRSELSGLPAASTRDLAIRSEIEKHLNGAIDRCRGRFEKASAALKSGEEAGLDGEAE